MYLFEHPASTTTLMYSTMQYLGQGNLITLHTWPWNVWNNVGLCSLFTSQFRDWPTVLFGCLHLEIVISLRALSLPAQAVQTTFLHFKPGALLIWELKWVIVSCPDNFRSTHTHTDSWVSHLEPAHCPEPALSFLIFGCKVILFLFCFFTPDSSSVFSRSPSRCLFRLSPSGLCAYFNLFKTNNSALYIPMACWKCKSNVSELTFLFFLSPLSLSIWHYPSSLVLIELSSCICVTGAVLSVTGILIWRRIWVPLISRLRSCISDNKIVLL